MSVLVRTVERVIARIKGEPSYRFTSGPTSWQLWPILWYRGLQWLRGLGLSMRASGVSGVVFRGRRVVIEHAGQLCAREGLILEDAVFINALSRDGITLGRNVTLARNATLLATGVLGELGAGIRLGDRCAVGAGSFLGGQGGIRVGDDTIMGPGVRILSENHQYDDVDVPIRRQAVSRRGVTIGVDCWIGAGATILDGVTLGDGCVVAAGAVVTRSMPPMSIVAGVPARVVKSRRPEETTGQGEGLRPPLARHLELLPPSREPRDVTLLRGDR